MEEQKISVWSSNRFWRLTAGWVTGFSLVLLIWLSLDSVPQISAGTLEDLQNGVAKRVPSAAVINYEIGYELDSKRMAEVPIIGGKQLFFGRNDYSQEEADELLNHGKMTVQSKNCMNCHTLLGNGAYYAPDLTKAWLDPMWSETGPYRPMTGKATTEEAMAEFLQHPSKYPTHARMMPDLGITPDEAIAVVAFLKHMSSIDTNGFPRNFNKIKGAVNAK